MGFASRSLVSAAARTLTVDGKSPLAIDVTIDIQSQHAAVPTVLALCGRVLVVWSRRGVPDLWSITSYIPIASSEGIAILSQNNSMRV